jgi:hypothetical protein
MEIIIIFSGQNGSNLVHIISKFTLQSIKPELYASAFSFCPQCIYGVRMILRIDTKYFPNVINQFVFVVEKQCSFYEVASEF